MACRSRACLCGPHEQLADADAYAQEVLRAASRCAMQTASRAPVSRRGVITFDHGRWHAQSQALYLRLHRTSRCTRSNRHRDLSCSARTQYSPATGTPHARHEPSPRCLRKLPSQSSQGTSSGAVAFGGGVRPRRVSRSQLRYANLRQRTGMLAAVPVAETASAAVGLCLVSRGGCSGLEFLGRASSAAKTNC